MKWINSDEVDISSEECNRINRNEAEIEIDLLYTYVASLERRLAKLEDVEQDRKVRTRNFVEGMREIKAEIQNELEIKEIKEIKENK